ncbi:MAG TPA: murein L,D-transpeptidase catalytic domain family protein [Hymenobacter sp.]|jgi:hypothetical protein
MNQAPTTFASFLLLLCSLLLPVAAAPGADAPHRSRKTTDTPVITDAAQRTIYLAAFEQNLVLTYAQAGLIASGMPVNVFREALLGFYSLQRRGMVPRENQVLTVIDFSRSSKQKRMWVIDMRQQRLLFHTLVAHGKNTGEEYAQTFSNVEGSEMSSLGFYRTGRTYQGKHGLSLKLHGLDPGYNTNAASRSIVVHGADYVSEDFIRQNGRLGRSQGCPALPSGLSSDVIKVIKGGSAIYIHGPATTRYASDWLQLDAALLGFARVKGSPTS